MIIWLRVGSKTRPVCINVVAISTTSSSFGFGGVLLFGRAEGSVSSTAFLMSLRCDIGE